ncbi:unnamed protein product [Parnassius mnemosyne]|uniref:PiggyBac transposable element-derived protein domain-containing protein n=1 Tax=Parnassius mnemosyne TaxID=213953 RepID=A0AAV1LDN6_9NEOP
MASKRNKLSRGKPKSLFRDDESNHDPYSDDDGEYGSDHNYEPADEDEDSSSDYSEIFDVHRSRFERNRQRIGSESEKSYHGSAGDQSDNGEQLDQNSVNERNFDETERDSDKSDCSIFDHHQIQVAGNEKESSVQRYESQENNAVRHHKDNNDIHLQQNYELSEYRNQQVEEEIRMSLEINEVIVRRGTPPPNDTIWEDTVSNIASIDFRSPEKGPTFEVHENTTCEEVFDHLFTTEMIEYLVERTNSYGAALTKTNRPHTRHARNAAFRVTNPEEMKKFLGLTLLNGHIRVPQQRKLFTYDDPLYFHPVFNYTMSCRRYVQILRCLYVADLGAKGSGKIEGFINTVTQNFRNVFNPGQDLSLDESLLLYRGRLIFRQYIKSKKARYGIKFYVLTTADGYVLNIIMYSGAENIEANERRTDKLVLRLMRPYLLKGHNLFMDNYYNSVTLSEKLLDLKTHTNGTLRKTRKDNPKEIVQKKLQKGQHVWARKGKVYVSAWKDKRDVYMVTTMDHPALIEVTNRFGKKKTKPIEVNRYNKSMSGVDRLDQMISYYSSPRKTIRWYKKVLFHIMDTTVWNSFYIYKNFVKKDKKYEMNVLQTESQLHENIERSKVETQDNFSQPNSGNHGHWPTRMMPSANSKKKYAFLTCKQCSKQKVRRDTSYFCKGCNNSPALCPSCFEDWHKDL